MNRRHLLKIGLGGSGVVSKALQPMLRLAGMAGGGIAWAQAALGSQRRASPETAVTLSGEAVQIVFNPKDALPHSYTFAGQKLWGEDEEEGPQVVLCQLQPREYRTVGVQVTGVKKSPRAVEFACRAAFGSSAAATFSLRYELDKTSLLLTLEAVHEQPGFELIEIATPQLVSVRQEDGPAWMAEGRRGGSFVKLDKAKAFRFPDHEYFGRISPELPVGLVGGAEIGCIMEVTAFEDGTETEIKGNSGSLHASIGCILTNRVHGGRCYSMNDGGKPVCGNSGTPNILTGQKSLTRFDFFTCAGQAQPWLVGAKIMPARTPGTPAPYLSDKFLYIVAGKRKIDPAPLTTFAQSRKLVRDVALLTDYAPQVALISGFAYEGQDTGFPSEDRINSSLGTDADLLQLIQDSRQINANVTLNVNYDDAYRSSPIFDEAFIARRPDGEIWKSRAWDGEDSYVVGMAKFMQGGWGKKRIEYTVDHFKIKDTLLIDAMSWFAVRDDWDPRHPASAYKNLVEGKYRIIEEFKQRGVAVTSEQLRYPFIGKLAESMDGPGVSNCPFGGEPVPLLPTIYRGAAIWGGTASRGIIPQHELFWNTRSALWFQNDSDRAKMMDFYYLVVLPFGKLHSLAVESYETTSTTRRIVLEQGSEVVMEPGSHAYAARWKGVEIARDDATFCPIDEQRIAFYTRAARTLTYPLPTGWNAVAVTGRTLGVEGRSPADVQVANGMLRVSASPRQPVVVYASADAIRDGATREPVR